MIFLNEVRKISREDIHISLKKKELLRIMVSIHLEIE